MKPVRPPLLTILYVAGLIGCFLNMILVLSPPVREISPWYPVYLSLGTIYTIVCLYNLWLMRKWAVWAFGVYVLANQMACWKLGIWNEKALLFSGMILAASLFYYRRMS